MCAKLKKPAGCPPARLSVPAPAVTHSGSLGMQLPDQATSIPRDSELFHRVWTDPPTLPGIVLRQVGFDRLEAVLQQRSWAEFAAIQTPGRVSACCAQSRLHNEPPLRSQPYDSDSEQSRRRFPRPGAGIPEPVACLPDQNKYPGEKLRRGVRRRTTSVGFLYSTQR